MTAARVRVYLPLDAASVARLVGPDRAVAVRSGYAVTSALGRILPGADVEELEYAAFTAAADAAAVGSGGSPARRVVGSADLPRAELTDAGDDRHPARVELATEVAATGFASFHVDDEAGELLWYDVSELATVAERLAAP